MKKNIKNKGLQERLTHIQDIYSKLIVWWRVTNYAIGLLLICKLVDFNRNYRKNEEKKIRKEINKLIRKANANHNG